MMPAPKSRGAVFFDIDGTIVAGNIVRYYADLRTQDWGRVRRALWTAAFALRVPWYLGLDWVSRAQFQRALYRNYRCFSPEELERRASRYFESELRRHVFPAAVARMQEHRERGESVALVSGSLRPIVAGLAARLPAMFLLAPSLEVRDGAFSGELAGEPLAGDAKARAVETLAARQGFDLADSHAYADSFDDLPMLRRVGHAHVVNAGPRLAREARRAGWELLDWHPAESEAELQSIWSED